MTLNRPALAVSLFLGAILSSPGAAQVRTDSRPAAPRPVALEATEGERAALDASFTIRRASDGAVIARDISGTVTLPPGRYRITAATATRSGEVEAVVADKPPAKVVVALVRALPPASLVPARVSAPATARLAVRWTGPDAWDDYIVFARPGAEGRATRHYAYLREGNPVTLRVPGQPGDYELRYVHGPTGAVLARTRVRAEAVAATLDGPAGGTAGAEVEFGFTGPLAEEDWVGFAPPGSAATAYVDQAWQYADNGSPARLRWPVEPGAYEVRYVSGLDPRVLASKVVTVAAASAKLATPGRAMAGSLIKVQVEGQGGGDSFVGIVRSDAPPRAAIRGATARPRHGEVVLQAPAEPGSHEVRFVLEANGAYKVLAAAPLTLEPAAASLTAPAEARAGSQVPVTLSGPRGLSDYVTIVAGSAAPEAYEDFRTVAEQVAVLLRAPDKPGAYEVRYVMRAPGSSGPTVLARRPIRIE